MGAALRPRSLGEVRLRSNPAVELVLFDRLAPHERESLVGLTNDPELFGIARERSGRGRMRSVSRDVALLFYTLREPGLLPAYVIEQLGSELEMTVAQLLVDGLFEIELDDGRFVGGPEARGALFGTHRDRDSDGYLARLSRSAVGHGAYLSHLEPSRLSARLYFYNRLPVSSVWRRRLQTPEAVEAFLGLSRPEVAEVLHAEWRVRRNKRATDSWMKWVRRGNRAAGVAHKVYISPQPDALETVIERLVLRLTDLPVVTFKVGMDVYGLLRPDKLVLYTESMCTARSVADSLDELLADVPAHGVPFTCQHGRSGLVSRGVDPNLERDRIHWQEAGSWRVHVTSVLASALYDAGQRQLDVEDAVAFAFDMLEIKGIDTETWLPRASS